MKSLTRFLSLFLAAILCSASFSACADAPTPPVASTTVNSPSTSEPGTDNTVSDTAAPVYTGTSVNDDTVAPESTETPQTDTTAAITEATTETTAQAARNDVDSIDGFDYLINENGSVTIVKYTGNDKNVIIPGNIDGRLVTEIGAGAFEECNTLESVKTPDTLKKIGNSAFYKCENLKTVDLNEGITDISDFAFYWCKALYNINLPEGLVSIGKRSFYYNLALENISLPSSLKRIDDGAFEFASLAKSDIIIPSGVYEIGEKAFCLSHPNTVTIEEGVEVIGMGAFAQSSVKKVVISASVKQLGAFIFWVGENKMRDIPIEYLGTQEQWDNIEKDQYWDDVSSEAGYWAVVYGDPR